MNGQSRLADRERMNRVAEASGKKWHELQDEMDNKNFTDRNGKQPKLWRENSGQHYPGFVDRVTKPIEYGELKVEKPKAVTSRGHTISDKRYHEEVDAQRKRAEALAYLASTDDGVPDDCLRGRAAAQRAKEKKSALSQDKDNTLALLSKQRNDDAYSAIQNKLVAVQNALRASGGLLQKSGGAPPGAFPPPPPPPRAAVATFDAALPPGWRAARHAATLQTYFVHDATGERRWTPPEGANDKTDMPDRFATLEDAGASKRKGAGDDKARKKAKANVDPLDPTGGGGESKWASGLHHKGERMADSTASGPLWQQRPYPAPSEVLKMKGPGIREGTSIGPSMPAGMAKANKPAATAFGAPRQARRAPPPPPPRPNAHMPRPPGL